MQHEHEIKTTCKLTSVSILDGALSLNGEIKLSTDDSKKIPIEILNGQLTVIEKELSRSLSVDERCKLTSTIIELLREMRTYR